MTDADEPPPGEPKPFDLLALLAAFARDQGIALDHPALVETFTADAGRRLERALTDSALLHGSRTERLFEATVLSLGQFRMLKAEDNGRIHGSGTLRAPDFRTILDDGTQWMIEVKNVRRKEPFKQTTTMSAAYLASLEAYAGAMQVPLRIAIYWSLWGIWTVIAPDHFRRADGSLRVEMQEAVIVNEFSRLGEVSIMTRPPLRLQLLAAKDRPHGVNDEGLAEFIIGAVRLFGGQRELVDLRDRKLAEVLISYGEWPIEGPTSIMEDGAFTGVEYVIAPEEPTGQDFDGIGWASRIFSRFYADQTVEGDRIIQLLGDTAPEWFAPLADWDFEHSKLSLILGRFEPNPELLETMKAQSMTKSTTAKNRKRPRGKRPN